jgi:hypothetical protein
MNVEITSYQLISECLKEYGKGDLFFRADGLQSDKRRAELRLAYLEAHPKTKAEHRDAIAKAAITPGMTKSEVTAAWGLLEEDTRMVFGHVTDDTLAVYACFTGFAVGESYALYFKDDVVIGVRQTEELVPPHEHELAMRLAEEYRGLFYFRDEGGKKGLMGNAIDLDHADWQREFDEFSEMESVPLCSRQMIEEHVKAKGLFPEYLHALQRLGVDGENVSECARVALEVLPYPPLALGPDEQGIEGYPFPPRGMPDLPPEKWFWYVGYGRPRQAIFPAIDGTGELLDVQWIKERLFRVNQVPLRVNGVSQFDHVEVEWMNGDLTPRFKRVVWNQGYRTIRVLAEGKTEGYLDEFVRNYVARPHHGSFRYEGDVLALTTYVIGSEFQSQLELLGASWIYTDTLNQQSNY